MGLGADSKYTNLLKTCDEAVEKMKHKQELEIALNSAVRSKNVDKLTECIAKVEASGVNIKLDSARKMKTSLIAQSSITDKLSAALVKNDVSVLERYFQFFIFKFHCCIMMYLSWPHDLCRLFCAMPCCAVRCCDVV